MSVCSDTEDPFEADLQLKHELMDAAVDRRGDANLPGLQKRNEHLEMQHQKDRLQRQLTSGASGFLREMQMARFERQATRVVGVNELTKEMIMDALSGIGRHPLSGKHALLELNLKNMQLVNCAVLKDFPNLVYVDIAKNAIQDISPLQSMTALTHLDASQNEIPTLQNFAPLLCSAGRAWKEGAQAIGSMLIYANLSKNKITDLQGLADHPFLECLLLGNNAISSMDGLQSLRNLQVLDLSFNELTCIGPMAGLQIQELNLKGNGITDLSGLEDLPRLRSLDVGQNQVADLSPLSRCLELSYLDISENRVAAVEDFFVLKACSNLRKLLALRNTASEVQSYRRQLIYQLPTLETLDVTFVSATEKLEAYNFYRHPLGDFALMQEVYSKYFPGETIHELEETAPAALEAVVESAAEAIQEAEDTVSLVEGAEA